MIALIDYKAGNLTSVRKALSAVNAEVFTPTEAVELGRARGIIVPGVGHFAATAALDASWTDTIRTLVHEGRPLLGICLGMQWLFERSDEAPDLTGLGVLSGACYRLASNGVKIPHVGWNTLEVDRHDSIVDGVPSGSQVYFTHSYVAPVTADTVARTAHGEPFASVVQRGRVAGVQFHPEKSSDVGLRILRNWLALAN